MSAAKPSNKIRFRAYAVLITACGILFMFLYTGLQNDHINIIQTFITEKDGGWNANITMLPITLGNFATIVLTFLYGTMLIKFGVRRSMIPIGFLTALGCVGLVLAGGLDCDVTGGSYPLFFISLFIIRCSCTIFQMGNAMLVTSWFSGMRGRVMGITTVGSPLFSVVCTAQMSKVIARSWNGNYRPFYIGLAVLIIIMILILVFLIKDAPEDAGLYPDGAETAPVLKEADDIKLTVGEVLRAPKTWLVIVAFGAYSFTLISCMATVALRFASLGGEDLWLKATTWLSVGSLCGIPISYLCGWMNDKIGAALTSFVAGIFAIICPAVLMFMPASGPVPILILWSFGVACLTGGIPLLGACLTTYAYGRRCFQSANRVIFAIELMPASVGTLMMTALIKSGHGMLAYAILITMEVIGIITAFILWRTVHDASKE